jgi:predicted DNA-binding transcriptional regulator YafY
VRLAQPWLDSALTSQVELALSKVLSVLPAAARASAESMAIFSAAPAGLSADTQRVLQTLREAIASKRKVRIRYLDLKEKLSERVLRPLACLYWGEVWTLASWCETRQDFRSFRIDRMESVVVLDDAFRDEPTRILNAFLAQVKSDRQF